MVKHKAQEQEEFVSKENKVKREEVLGREVSAEVASSVWSDTAAELEQMEFKDIDEAMGVLVERVLVKLDGAEAPDEDLKSFLYELLDSDPELKEELGKIFKVS